MCMPTVRFHSKGAWPTEEKVLRLLIPSLSIKQHCRIIRDEKVPGTLNLAGMWTNHDTGLLYQWVITVRTVSPAYCERCMRKGGRWARDPALGNRTGLMGSLVCAPGAPVLHMET